MMCDICQKEIGGGALQFYIHLTAKKDGMHNLSKQEAKKIMKRKFPKAPFTKKF